MYFKRLEMHGFKSFAEPLVVDFHEGITCVVGPNGSGKSNISDALRWVLGEQSPRALRGGKMEEVIFSGTESRRPRGMAEVTLVIDNSAGILDIEYKEVAITRRMYRSGESEYLINNNPCRLKDIRELIMDTGIGVDGYSIIGQGKIADIVSNKPESRREIFEESAGIVAYKTRKHEAERKLDSTKGNLERIDDIVGEIESRIDGLKEDSEKAERYLTLRDRYKDLEINITLRNIDNAVSRNAQYEEDIKELDTKIGELSEKRQDRDIKVRQMQQRNIILDNLNTRTNNEKVESIEKINAIVGQNEINKEKLASFDREEQRLSGEIEELKARNAKALDEKVKLEEEAVSIEKEKKDADGLLQEKILEYNTITSETTRFTEMMAGGNDRIIDLNSEMAAKKSEADTYENYKQTLGARKTQLEEDISRGTKEKESAEKTKSSLEKELSDTNSQKARIDKEIADKKAEKGKLSAKELDLRREIEELKINSGRMEARRRTIEELEQNLDGYNQAVKFILRTGFSGIEGVVGEMINVPHGLETAIETALGATMQNIICKDDTSAKNAITALKVNKAGRLTFLPVSSIKGRMANLPKEITGAPGFKGIAVDLIEFDEKYRNIYEYLLGRVCVVDHIDSAIALSKKDSGGVRFVTLEGEIINASGAITGGKFKNKTANLLERKNEIEKLKAEMEEYVERLGSMEKELAATLSTMEEIDGSIGEAEADSMEYELAMAALKEKINAQDTVASDLEGRVSKAKDELSQVTKELSGMDDLIARMLGESKAAESEIEKISKEMEDVSAQHQEKREAMEKANQEITDARIEAEKWSQKKNGNDELLSRVNAEIETIGNQIKEKTSQIEAIDSERETLQFGDESGDERIAELKALREEQDQKLASIEKEKAELTAELSALNEELASSEEELNSYRDQKYQLDIRVAKSQTQLENMKEKLWDEFDISYAQALDLRKEEFAMTAAVKESREIRKELKEIGDVNVGAIEEYRQVKERYDFLTEQREDVVKARDELLSIISNLDATIIKSFKENFDKVAENFEKVFGELFGGGHAELRMEDESDPLESGIEIVAQPPGKKLQNINLMSGGEKTMTAIALMFAVLKARPTPFCILDEVEAALDDENIDKFAGYLRYFTDTQFVLITHQKATMEHADVLYGITMPERGISKVLSLRMGDYDPDEYTN